MGEPGDEGPAGLVEAAIQGDRAAFGKLHGLYARMVHGVLISRVPVVEADDLLQEVFLLAWQKLDSLDDPVAFGGWIAAIARRCAADFLRRRRTTVALPEEIAQARRPSVEAQEVLEIIRNLPPAYSETLAMRLVEGMTGPEIAAQTGLTPASVRVNLHRGMKLLRERIGVEAGR